jgi:hypothetical protein
MIVEREQYDFCQYMEFFETNAVFPPCPITTKTDGEKNSE